MVILVFRVVGLGRLVLVLWWWRIRCVSWIWGWFVLLVGLLLGSLWFSWFVWWWGWWCGIWFWCIWILGCCRWWIVSWGWVRWWSGLVWIVSSFGLVLVMWYWWRIVWWFRLLFVFGWSGCSISCYRCCWWLCWWELGCWGSWFWSCLGWIWFLGCWGCRLGILGWCCWWVGWGSRRWRWLVWCVGKWLVLGLGKVWLYLLFLFL